MCSEAVTDELEFLRCAYGDCFILETSSNVEGHLLVLRDLFHDHAISSIHILLPPGYPSHPLQVIQIETNKIRYHDLRNLRYRLDQAAQHAAEEAQITCLEIIQICNDFIVEVGRKDLGSASASKKKAIDMKTLPNTNM